jgi:5'-methylthioadenosine phosphorylase
MDFGVIGGTGLCRLSERGEGSRLAVDTQYGLVEVDRTRLGDIEVAFIARHGWEHDVPPHRVNYRANIAALQELGVRNVLASAAVGSMSDALPPGSLAIVTQFLDFTHGRESTFFGGEGGQVVHTDMTEPYCPHLRGELDGAAGPLGEQVRAGFTYVCAQGPRFETPAEIRMFRQLGGDVVGMTTVPEVTLAREAGICYATVAIVTNWAAGMSDERVQHGAVGDFMSTQTPRVRALFAQVVGTHKDADCSCRSAVSQ